MNNVNNVSHKTVPRTTNWRYMYKHALFGGKEEEADEAQDDEGQPYDELVGLNRPPFCNCNQFTCECSPLDSCDDIFADS